MKINDFTNQYRQFCANAPADFPVFMQDWYLDAVCEGGEWAVAITQNKGQITGVWPYFLKQKWHWTYVAMPMMGKLMGPYILPELRQPTSEMRIMEALYEQLPDSLAAFQQDFNYTITNWLPLYWKGFNQTTRYSYILPLMDSEEILWKGIEKSYRRKIGKAKGLITVRSDFPLSECYRVCGLSFDRQSRDFPLSLAYFEKIDACFVSHNARKIFFAVDQESNAVHSVVYLVWDQSAAYLLMGGDDPVLRTSGSGVLLQWEAILFAKNELNLPVFDFEGSMIKPVEQGRRYFGGQQRPYFRVQKEWSWIWKWGKRLLR